MGFSSLPEHLVRLDNELVEAEQPQVLRSEGYYELGSCHFVGAQIAFSRG